MRSKLVLFAAASTLFMAGAVLAYFVVEKGLAEGDRVAVSSLQMLRDGAEVKIKEQTVGER